MKADTLSRDSPRVYYADREHGRNPRGADMSLASAFLDTHIPNIPMSSILGKNIPDMSEPLSLGGNITNVPVSSDIAIHSITAQYILEPTDYNQNIQPLDSGGISQPEMVLQFRTSAQRFKSGMGAQHVVKTLIVMELGEEAQLGPQIVMPPANVAPLAHDMP